MYYRRKILLSLLQTFDNGLSKMSLQKLLFLFTRNQNKPSYDFVPYKFGCYSFTAAYDLKVLSGYNLVGQLEDEHNEFWNKKDDNDYVQSLTESDRKILLDLKSRFDEYTQDELIRYVYLQYPYYAINSTILLKLLSKKETLLVTDEKKNIDEVVLFTIGYEGKSIESFLNQLIINNIRTLVDVRRNAISKKFGFSKSQLKHACENLGINYIHLPELGIQSNERKGLVDIDDYRSLFASYEAQISSGQTDHLNKIIKELDRSGRIAITCFEAQPEMCHRSSIIKLLLNRPGWNIPVKHL